MLKISAAYLIGKAEIPIHYTQQVELDLSYATSCKKVYQRYKAYV